MSRADAPSAAPPPIARFELLPLLADRPDGAPAAPPVPPTGIVPFAIGEGDARDRFGTWIAARRPIGSRRRAVVESLRAVYVPIWTFTARVRVPWRATKVRTKRRRSDHDSSFETVPIDGVVELAFDDELVPASASVPADLVTAVEPAPAAELVPWDPGLVAGHPIEPCTVSLRDAWDTVDARLQAQVTLAVRRDAGLTATDLESWPEWSGQQCRQVLAPIYVVDYTFGGQRYVAVVNGRSGAVEGRRPPDWIARVLAAAVLLALLAGLVLLVILLLRWLF